MKIICTKSNLSKGVSIVSKAVPSKTTMPILECILIDASTDVIKLTANDRDFHRRRDCRERNHCIKRENFLRDR